MEDTLATVVLVILAIMDNTKGQNCTQFLLTEQPPSTLDCNPYFNTGTDHVWRLRSSCTVKNIGNALSFQLHWFHRNSNNEVIDLGMPEFYTSSLNTKRVMFGNNLTNEVYSESMLGNYWCQVTGVNGHAHNHRPGNIITIHPPGYYGNQLAVCSGTITVTTAVCIDSPCETSTTTGIITGTSVTTTSSKGLTKSTIRITPSVTINIFNTPLSNGSSQVANDSTEQNNDEAIPTGVIIGAVVAIVMLVTASILVVCMIVMIAKKNKLPVLERIPINKMKSVINPSLMEKNPSYTMVTIGQARLEGDHGKGVAPPMAQPTQPLHNSTQEWKSEPVYVNTTNIERGYDKTCSKTNKQPHYENMEFLKSSSREGRQLTNQNAVTSTNTYYQNVSLKANNSRLHYYNTRNQIVRQKEWETKLRADSDSHDYANLATPNIIKQTSLDVTGNAEESHNCDSTTGSTATLTMNEVL